ncbi:MAG: endonuclease III [archaeon]
MSKLEKEYVSARMPTIRRTSKETRDPFKVLISCLLSLRTTDHNTEIASEKLFAVASTPKAISNIPIKKLEKLIFSSGHYHKKAQVLKSVSKDLLKRFKGKVPKTREELLTIKGIGPKTANIVLQFAYGQEVLPIDTHCHRVPNRFGWIQTKTPEQSEKELEKILPKRFWKEFNSVIILFAKEICQPLSPKCSQCYFGQCCPKIGVTRSR